MIGTLSTLTAACGALLTTYTSIVSASAIPHAKRDLGDSGTVGFPLQVHGTGVKTASLLSHGSSSPTTISDYQDTTYTVEMLVGGQPFTVLMDTGSSDLWISNVPSKLLTNTTNVRVTESYGKGVASGPLAFAEIAVGPYSVPQQVFLNADQVQDFGTVTGIIGLSFNVGPIYQTLSSTYGPSAANTYGLNFISSVFAQNPNSPSYFDVDLGRTSDLDDTNPGTFTISEHVSAYAGVGNAPSLARQSTFYWGVNLDGMNVNGQGVSMPSSGITGTPAGKLMVILDTGFSYPPLPKNMIDAIYGSIPGAVLNGGQWIVPCMSGANLTFTLGGQQFPVHPLDLTITSLQNITNSNGQIETVTFCTNTYQYSDLNPANFPFDGVLGDAFLRNVYASFNFGNNNTPPFIQLLSQTSQDAAWSDFQSSRSAVLSHLPPTMDPAAFIKALGGSGSSGAAEDLVASGGSASSDSTDGSTLSGSVQKYGPLVVGLLAGNLLIMTLLLIVGVVACMRGLMRGGAKSRNVSPTYAPVRFKEPADEDHKSSYSGSY